MAVVTYSFRVTNVWMGYVPRQNSWLGFEPGTSWRIGEDFSVAISCNSLYSVPYLIASLQMSLLIDCFQLNFYTTISGSKNKGCVGEGRVMFFPMCSLLVLLDKYFKYNICLVFVFFFFDKIFIIFINVQIFYLFDFLNRILVLIAVTF